MSILPTRKKSIFAPENQSRRNSIFEPSRSTTSIGKSQELITPSISSLISNSITNARRPSLLGAPDGTPSFLKPSSITNRPKRPYGRSSLSLKTFAPNPLYKKSATLKPRSQLLSKGKSSDSLLSGMQTPTMFKEYKYRKSILGDSIIKEDPHETRKLQRLSIFSAYTSNIIDTRPVDLPRLSFSKRLRLQIALMNGTRFSKNQPQSSHPTTSSPIYPGRSSANRQTTPSSMTLTTDEEGPFSTERLRLRRILKKGLHAMYFIGVLITFKNKVVVYGAMRPLEYLEEFELLKADNRKDRFLPILPTSTLYRLWGFILIFLTLVSAVWTPVYISFIEDEDNFFFYLNILIDLGFALDILISFVTAYNDPKKREIVLDLQKIAVNYLKTWFLVDLVSVIPISQMSVWLFSNPNKLYQIHKIWRLLRFVRLLKIDAIIKLMKMDKAYYIHSLYTIRKKLRLNVQLTKIVKIFVNFAFLNHVVGCIWFYMAKLDDFGPDTWIVRSDLIDKSPTTLYISSIYWSFQTLTTVGYGDIAPQTSLERLISVILTVIGVLIYSFTLGNLSSILYSYGKKERSLKDRLTSFEQFSTKVGLPNFLSQKVRRFFEINHKENACYWIDPKDFLKSLPANLKTSLLLFSYYDCIKEVSFLQINANLTAALLVHMKFQSLSKGELIYREGDPSNEIYFILKGAVKFMTQNEQDIYSLSMGTYFGEVEVFEKKPRQFFSQALEQTLLLLCPKEAFLRAMEDFPDMKAQMLKMVTSRKLKLRDKFKKIQKSLEEESRSNGLLKRRALSRKTDYVNKVLLKIPDFKVRYELRRMKEKSMLVKPMPNYSLTDDSISKKPNKSFSLGAIWNSRESLTHIPRKIFHKSLTEFVGRESKKERFFTSPNRKAKVVPQKMKESEPVRKKEDVGTLSEIKTPEMKSVNLSFSSPIKKGLNMSESELGSIVSELKDHKFESLLDQIDAGSLSSLMPQKAANNLVKSEKEFDEEPFLVKRGKSSLAAIEEIPEKTDIVLVSRPQKFWNKLFSSIKDKTGIGRKSSPNKIIPINSKRNEYS